MQPTSSEGTRNGIPRRQLQLLWLVVLLDLCLAVFAPYLKEVASGSDRVAVPSSSERRE
jgi:hypothetical protein